MSRAGATEGHQVKRQVGTAANWTIHRLGAEGVLEAAKLYADAGRGFSFVSTVPAEPFTALVDAARRAQDFAGFEALIDGNQTLRTNFDSLAEKWGGATEAWPILANTTVWHFDERVLEQTNAAIAQLLFDGPPDAAAATLAEIAADNTGVPLTADRLWQEAAARGLVQNTLWDAQTVADLVAKQTGRFLIDAHSRMFDPPIERDETAKVIEAIERDLSVIVVAGAAGGGKSAAVADVVDELVAKDAAVLALRLDLFMDVRSSRQLGAAVDLPVSPTVAVARAAAGRRPVLVIDQLDAVSVASGRAPEVFAVVEELRGEAARLGVQVVLACRRYDIDNDPRLKSLVETRGQNAPEVVEVAMLTDEEVARVLQGFGLNASLLTQRQRQLLQLPLNLALLRALSGDAEALTFETSQDLLASYWTFKKRAVLARRASVEFDRIVHVLAEEMSQRQTLTVPEQVLQAEGLDTDIDLLASENVLIQEKRRLAFFHETVFDYVFARGWMSRGESVVGFLVSGEQELFRRAQIRQVLLHIHDLDRERFVSEVRELLADDRVRYHIKDSIFAILRAISDPSTSEVGLAVELMSDASPWRQRVEFAMTTPGWFAGLDRSGHIEEWLSSSDFALNERAIAILAQAGERHADRAAELLELHTAHPQYHGWLTHVARFIDADSSRALFDLILRAVREGAFDTGNDELFVVTHRLGDNAPEWGAELLACWFAERPDAWRKEELGQLTALSSSEYSFIDLITKSAEGAPAAFVRLLLPYMQRVMRETEQGEDLPRRDWHFSSQTWHTDVHQVDDALMVATVGALRTVAEREPTELRALVEPLADDEHAGAQDLLYEALTAAGAAHADWAAELLLRGGWTLRAGYSGNPYWRTYELLVAISGHFDDQAFAAIEELVSNYKSDWELTNPRARPESTFVLLSGLTEARLSEQGRRRLGELRRLFDSEVPPRPMGMMFGVVGSPIEEADAKHMSDAQWIGAMRRHTSDEGDWQRLERGGGAYQLSNVLQAATARDPERFARLALALDDSYNRNYLQGILLGVGATELGLPADLSFDLIRHAANVGGQDRWLSQPLRAVLDEKIPDDVIELFVARALGVTDLQACEPNEVFSEEPHDMGNPSSTGLNSIRGSNAHALTRLVASDHDGRRGALISPYIERLAKDPSAAVRVWVAELVWALLRWDRDNALLAFDHLVADRAPDVLTEQRFGGLMFAVIMTDVERALAVAEEMTAHADEQMREHGARYLTLAAIEAGRVDLLPIVAESDDSTIRRGAAFILAARLRWSEDAVVADTLAPMFADSDERVREAAATFAGNLRGQRLVPFRQVIDSFLSAPFAPDITELLFTLENAPEPEHELVLKVAHRVIEEEAAALGDLRTRAAGHARYLSRLILRSYSLAENVELRRECLDAIDRLLQVRAYGVADAIDELRR